MLRRLLEMWEWPNSQLPRIPVYQDRCESDGEEDCFQRLSDNRGTQCWDFQISFPDF
jgi:hypothetical protein